MGSFEKVSSLVLGLAVLHTFICPYFKRFKSPILHLLSEVEIVFGLWSAIFLIWMAVYGWGPVEYLKSLSFKEPLFVFVIMVMSATKPVLELVRKILYQISKGIPLKPDVAFYFTALSVGPLLGSFITEPAAMTVVALLLSNLYFSKERSSKFRYLTLGTLFVNVSTGGALTPFAAPPILMVATKFEWGLSEVFLLFGWKAILAVFLNATLATFLLRSEFSKAPHDEIKTVSSPALMLSHCFMIAATVMGAHHVPVFMAVFLFFLGFAFLTRRRQSHLRLRESFLVAFFLAGIVIIGSAQTWWIQNVLASLNAGSLYLVSAFLTSFTDNAALTYIGSQAMDLSPELQYALVSGAIVGGGMTVIANAPNPAGYAILEKRFGKNGISALKLAGAALIPTLIAMGCFWWA